MGVNFVNTELGTRAASMDVAGIRLALLKSFLQERTVLSTAISSDAMLRSLGELMTLFRRRSFAYHGLHRQQSWDAGSVSWIIMATVSGLAACDRGESNHPVVVSDSAGETVFRVSSTGRMTRWTTSDSPTVVIAPDERGETTPLFFITGAHRFDDGSLVVASSGNHELRYYASDGKLIKIVGREGAGPEEFGSLGFVQEARDSLWVHDLAHSRIAVLDRGGRFGRLVPLTTWSAERTKAMGVFDDGSFLLSHPERRTAIEPGPYMVHEQLFVGNPDGTTETLPRVFIYESYWHDLGDRMMDSGLPFGRAGLLAIHGQEWFYTDGKEYRIERYDKAGTRRGIFAYAGEPSTVTEADFEQLLRDMRGDRPEPSRREQLLRQTPLPERMPAYSALKVDGEGNVWARPYGRAGSQNCWHVYQIQPARFAEACLPDRFQAFEIGEDWVLGVERDSLDVETVAVFHLAKRSQR
jgi:hypothetical protein